MTEALFVDPKGIYPELLGAEHCWDEKRDARTYAGAWPVVAHPPCNLWVNMAAVNWKRYGRQLPAWYPGGTDEGCFASALESVRRCGGVLEHPAGSHAWADHRLGCPMLHGATGWFQTGPNYLQHPACYPKGLREWQCEVWQSAYGHQARKRTWLLYVGRSAPQELDWSRQPGTHQVGWFDRNKPTLSKKQASSTPVEFAQALIGLARWSGL